MTIAESGRRHRQPPSKEGGWAKVERHDSGRSIRALRRDEAVDLLKNKFGNFLTRPKNGDSR